MANILSTVTNTIVLDDFTYVLAAFIISVVLFFAMMIYYKIRVLKLEQYIEYLKEQNRAAAEVSQIARKIEADLYNKEPKANSFEDEQETKAIISYQELLKKESDADYPFKKQVPSVAPIYGSSEIDEQIKLVPVNVREETILEKPIVRENAEFLSSLTRLRKNLK